MPASRVPGPTSQADPPADVCDGPACRPPSAAPGPVGHRARPFAPRDARDGPVEAARRAAGRLPADARARFDARLGPENLAFTAGVLEAWAWADLAGGDLSAFARGASGARDGADLDRAADRLARSVARDGVDAFVALVFASGAQPGLKAGGRFPRGGDARAFEGTASPEAGEPGPRWEATGFGDDFPGTFVPRGFQVRVGGRAFRVTPNACKPMAERLRAGVPNPTGPPRPRSPWRSQVDYPIGPLAGALERAAERLSGLPPGRHESLEGNWELGVDTADDPWAVYHARPLGQ